MTYTEQDVRKFINEAYRAGVEEGIRRARERAARDKPANPVPLTRT